VHRKEEVLELHMEEDFHHQNGQEARQKEAYVQNNLRQNLPDHVEEHLRRLPVTWRTPVGAPVPKGREELTGGET